MSVKVRPFRNGGWEVDVIVRLQDGRPPLRKRFKATSETKAMARIEGQRFEEEVIRLGRPEDRPEVKEVPTLKEFESRFMTDYGAANRLKHSTMVTQQSIIRTHLVPMFGDLRLDKIGNREIQALRGSLVNRNAKTANNIVGVLGKMLRVAVEWGVIEKMPFRVKPLKTESDEMRFYEDSEFERLVSAARKVGPAAEIVVLLGGEAGLRAGEMLGLEWSDIDFPRGHLQVRRSIWCGAVGTPKGGRSRRVPMTARLLAVLKTHRHLRGKRVLMLGADDPSMKALKSIRSVMKSVQRIANLEATGNVHILRHTFCSRLAMRGRSALEIKELAGHAHLATTMRYMHLSPSAVSNAVASLESPLSIGDSLETSAKNEGVPFGTPSAS